MQNAEPFYKILINNFSEQLRSSNEEYMKADLRFYEIFDLLKDKTIPFEKYIALQKEEDSLKQKLRDLKTKKDTLEYAREIIFDTYEEFKNKRG